MDQVSKVDELTLFDRGGIAEQVVGQLLRCVFPSYAQPNLYYWQREKKGSSAEIDYVFQHGHQVFPIEVKAGSTGSLKSLHFFMGKKGFSIALRINSDYPSCTPVKVKDQSGKDVEYTLLSVPFYLIGQIHRLISCFS